MIKTLSDDIESGAYHIGWAVRVVFMAMNNLDWISQNTRVSYVDSNKYDDALTMYSHSPSL